MQPEVGSTLRTETSPPYDDQAKGAANAVRRIKGQVRSIRSGLESRLGSIVGRDHPLVPWMIRHSGSLITRCQVGADGKTPHERLRGRAYDRAVAEFGEKLLHLSSPGPMGVGSGAGGTLVHGRAVWITSLARVRVWSEPRCFDTAHQGTNGIWPW